MYLYLFKFVPGVCRSDWCYDEVLIGINTSCMEIVLGGNDNGW